MTPRLEKSVPAILILYGLLTLVLSAKVHVKRVAVVTGGNKGIGYAIVKELCEKFDGDVFLTARDRDRGMAAVESLKKLGYKPRFSVLDVTNPESVEEFHHHMFLQEYGGIDILINNAGVAYKLSPGGPIESEAQEIMDINYFGFRDTCNKLLPIMKPNGRVVNLSGSVAHLSYIPGQNLRDTLASPDLTEEKLSNLMSSFLRAVRMDKHNEEGWPNWAYAVSKVGVAALTRIHQRELLKDTSVHDVVVNHVHPGYVRTDLTGNEGDLTPEEGAQVPVYLAFLPENCTSPRGDFVWSNKEIVDWVNGPLPKAG